MKLRKTYFIDQIQIRTAYMSNGFDPYGGQLMMMPYGGGPPFSINPAEYYNNDVQPYLSDELSQKDSSIDSPVSSAIIISTVLND